MLASDVALISARSGHVDNLRELHYRYLELSAAARLTVEVASDLASLVTPGAASGLLDKTTALRRQMVFELGVVVPGIRFLESQTLPAGRYVIRLGEVPIGVGSVVAGSLLAIPENGNLDGFPGKLTREPIYGTPAAWITPADRERAEQRRAGLYDVSSVIIIHLAETIRCHACDLLGRQEVRYLLDFVSRQQPDLVTAVLQALSLGEVRGVLQGLLRERVSIRNITAILEGLADIASTSRSAVLLLEAARGALGMQIRTAYSDDAGYVHAIVLEESIEEQFLQAARHVTQNDDPYKTLRPPVPAQLTQHVLRTVNEARGRARNNGLRAVLVVHPAIRLFVQRLLEPFVPQPVLSWNEVLSQRHAPPRVRVCEIIRLSAPAEETESAAHANT